MSVQHIWWLLAALLALCSARVRSSVQEETRPDYGVYHNLSAVYAEVASLARTHPNYVRVEPGFETASNLSRLVVRVGNFSNATDPPELQIRRGSPKVRVLLLFGVRGGELVTVESALHLLKKLLATRNYSVPGRFGAAVLSKVDLHIVVLASPDARKRVERTGDFCSDATKGPNLDAPLFGPDHAEETETLRVLANLSRVHAFDAVVAFRSGAREIRLPFAPPPQSRLRPSRQPLNVKAATALAEAIARATTPRFIYTRASRPPLLRLIDGKPLDAVRKAPFSLSIGLWDGGHGDGSHCFRQLNPGSASLEKTLEQLDPLYEALFLHLIRWKEGQSANKWKKLSTLWFKLAGLKVGIIILVAAVFSCRRCRASEYTQP